MANLADTATGVLTPTLRLGVTGLSRAGKTIFITALIHNLLTQGRLPGFSPLAEGRFIGAKLAEYPDATIPRFTWWDHRGTTEWIEWGFPKMRKVSAVEVYWFDDTGRGQCRVPQSWRVLYRVGERWTPVAKPSSYNTELDRYNRVTFAPVECNGLRIEAQLQPNFSAGILEWKVE